MIGLIYKDLKTVLAQVKIVVILLALYFGYTVYLKDFSFFTSIESVLGLILVMLSFGFDEKTGWDKIACTMPLGRKTIVISRYLFGGVVYAVLGILHILVGLFLKTPFMEILDSLVMSFGISLILMAVMFPVIYKMGMEKARMFFLIFFLGMLVLTNLVSAQSFTFDFGMAKNLLILACSLILILVSVYISVKIYQSKEFK